MIDLAVEDQIPAFVRLHGFHERVGHQNRHIEVPKPCRVFLGGDEILDIGVVAAHRRHHRAAARAGAHDRAAHGVPDIHEAERPRGVGADAADRCALRPQGREIVADAAALLHGQRGLLQVLEDAAHVVGDRAHDEAVEQRHVAAGAGAGQDAAGRQELKIDLRIEEGVRPLRGFILRGCQRRSYAPPGILDAPVDRGAVGRLEAVLHVPDLLCDGADRRHGVAPGRAPAGAPVLDPAPRPVKRCSRYVLAAAPGISSARSDPPTGGNHGNRRSASFSSRAVADSMRSSSSFMKRLRGIPG